MAQTVPEDGRRPGAPDPFAVAAAAFLVLALIFGAYPALRIGPASLGVPLMLAGLAAVALFAFLALRRASSAADDGDDVGATDILDAITGPAALATADGRVVFANPAWGAAVGSGRRLPPSAEKGALFRAMAGARPNEAKAVKLKLAGTEREAAVALLGARRYLVQLHDAPQPPQVPPAAPQPAVRALAAQLDAFAAAAPFGAALLDGADVASAAIARTNAAFEAMTGGKGVVGARLPDIIEAASWSDALGRMEANQGGPAEVRLAHDPTRIAHLYLSSADGGLIAYLVDVSEQKQIELQLAQSEKMRAIGQFAGGVAHDFNNLLTAVNLKLDELLARHPVGDPSYEDLVEIRSTADRAADLVRKLLAYSRKQTVQREILDLGELISEFEVLLRRLLREDVRLETDYGRNLPLVRGDKGQLETAVMNLAVNARDAVRAQGGGVVRIKTARLSLPEARALGYADERVAAQEIALIEVADNGPGVPPDALSKIFDPFYTTKPVGEGTGLGLATVYGIVKQADGWIHVESKPGQGAVFRIFLPVYVRPLEVVTPAPAAPARPAPRDLSGIGRILFVEDEEQVRSVAARLLRARGYEVLEAADGEEALILAEANAGKIDLMISDVIMPGIDGPTLLKRARGHLGSAPVMFISGYAEAEFSDLLEDEPGVTFLPKPLDIKILAERVKQQLQAA
jgi:two-component system cell cycle sensor histidine kinase/response regulator CckA